MSELSEDRLIRLVEAALARSARRGARVGVLLVEATPSLEAALPSETLEETLAGAIRSGDLVLPAGPQRHLVILEPIDGVDELVAVAERLLDALDDLGIQPAEGRNTIRIGAALNEDPRGTARTLVAEATTAAARATTEGDARIAIFDPVLNAEFLARSRLGEELARALRGGELHLDYQPIVHLRSNEVLGFEALLRWEHPTRGELRADAFVGHAQLSDRIVKFDRWVLGQVTNQLALWAEEPFPGSGSMWIAMNISARSLGTSTILDEIGVALESRRLRPELLVLEVTEAVTVEDFVALDRLNALRGLGVRIALDDLGTGSLPVNRLAGLPIDIVKLDRSFVEELSRQPRLADVVVNMAHGSGLLVIAEGVEEDAQLDLLRTVGCDAAQGYLLAPPDALDSFRLPEGDSA